MSQEGVQIIRTGFKPLPFQAEIINNLKKYNVCIVHRGAGKSYLCAQYLVKQAFTCPDESGALFMYVAPEKQQAKDVIWAKLKYAVREIEGVHIREDELTITFPDNNAQIRLEGADKPDRLRGVHPHLIVLDEVGNMKQDTWYEVLMPAVQRNRGQVIFIGTPKGDNLLREIYEIGTKLMGQGNPEWYTVKRDVYSTGVYTDTEISNIKAGMPPSKWSQEYLLDFEAIFTGAYYSDVLDPATSSAVDDVPYNPMYPVYTGWDLGYDDRTCIWFAQYIQEKFHFIDYYENSKKDIYHYLNYVKNKNYIYAKHIVPHDVAQNNMVMSRIAAFRQLGMSTLIAPKTKNVVEDINTVHAHLYVSRFDRRRCQRGIQHLLAYRSRVDQKTGLDTGTPLHDAASDAADALRTFFMGFKKSTDQGSSRWGQREKRDSITEFDIYGGGSFTF